MAVDTNDLPMSRKTIFVAGLGMVGIAFIEKIIDLDADSKYRIVTCGEEPTLPYNRVALTEYFQHRSVEKLYLNKPEWYTQQDPERFQFYVGEQVISINHSSHTVTTDRGRTISYDICVLATGSNADMPPYVTPEQAKSIRGVFVYRNIADLDAIMAYAEQEHITAGKAAVLGGGLLGLEAAKAVSDLEKISNVTIINRSAFPLSRQLDDDAGEMVLRCIEALGVEVLTKTSIRKVTTCKDPSGEDVFKGLLTTDGIDIVADLVIFAIGIKPRDDLARNSGIECNARGGVLVDDHLATSAKDVYAIGECASWKGNSYGLIAPGVEMADILAFNLTQTETSVGTFKPRLMNDPDLSTKLKLMGVDVASFGDFFADQRMGERMSEERGRKANGISHLSQSNDAHAPNQAAVTNGNTTNGNTTNGITQLAKARRTKRAQSRDEPVQCLIYRDPFASVYKKYIFTVDGKYLLGGMMIGDTSDFVKLVATVKKKKALDVPPSQFIIGSKKDGQDDGAELDDDAQVCSCHNVLKGTIEKCVKNGIDDLNGLKSKTKAGTGCGGCMPLVTNLFKASMKKSGHSLSNNLCPHFNMSRADLFNVIKIKKLRTSKEVMEAVGVNPSALGCEICKPAMGSIFSSLWNEPVMNSEHHHNQDTNDRYLANMQRNGTFSVIPRVAGGEITPDKLIVLGQVAKRYNLYTKITGGQRIDLFGAQKQDLPDVWGELVQAGFESGHAYGKALRTVKSCVGTTWCRYGVGDSVGLAIQLEERYKGIRAPHKIKGGVSGCVRECAEAQSKDFGLIATDKGWNVYLGGNGGTNPRHATLFAKDVPPSKVIRIIDRFLMFYIRTADRLMRTARWVEQFEGGIEKLKKIILDDELGICADLDEEMDKLVGTYTCEWAEVVKDPERKKLFRPLVNSDAVSPLIEPIVERGQSRPADWPKAFPPTELDVSQIPTPRDQWQWKKVAKVADLPPATGATSAAIKYGDTQIAIFHVPNRGYYGTQQMCPHRRAFVLDHGIVGDDAKGNLYVSCPLHKRNFNLINGECTNDREYKVLTFDVREEDGDILMLLPEPDELDSVLGTSKWMVRRATADMYGKGAAGLVEIVGSNGQMKIDPPGSSCTGGACGNNNLDW